MDSHRTLQYFTVLFCCTGGCIWGSFEVQVLILCLVRCSYLLRKGK